MLVLAKGKFTDMKKMKLGNCPDNKSAIGRFEFFVSGRTNKRRLHICED